MRINRGTPLPSEPICFHVFLYATVAAKIRNIQAPDHRAAAEAAQVIVQETMGALCRHAGGRGGIDELQYAEETTYAVVDVDGDEDYEKTQDLTAQGSPLYNLARRVVEWADGGRDEASFQELLAMCRAHLTDSF